VTLLRTEGLAIVRGGRLLLESLDLAVAGGDAVHLTGPNGAGKSSLLRCLAGLLAPAAGRVERLTALALADDRLPLDAELPLRRALGFWAAVDPQPTVLSDALIQVGLHPLADVPVRLFSSGQRKRAALGLVAMSNAPMWLLDEPLNALDEDGRKRLEAMIAAHRASGGGVIAASHLPLGGTGWRELALGR
jgi:heme exporter protein A